MATLPGTRAGAADWWRRWRAILPILGAEFVVWLGFGAVLPVLPLFIHDRGIDLATLGLIVAAWPAARLVGEPLFGALADRMARRPIMVAGLLATGVFLGLTLVAPGAPAFLVLRALTGLATSAYDPAARGYLSDSTPPERQGEAFGLYGAAQMGGLLFGPAIGGLSAAVTGDAGSVFLVGSVAVFAAAVVLATGVRSEPAHGRSVGVAVTGLVEVPSYDGVLAGRAAAEVARDPSEVPAGRPASLWNRRLIAAVVLTSGVNFAAGVSEVNWSLWLTSLGNGLDFIGLTFAAFGASMLLLSPAAGRRVDRQGTFRFIVAGSSATALAGLLYGLVVDPALIVAVIVFEGASFAFLSPALYSVAAAGSPLGRTSTAQGVFGAAGTIGFIVSSIASGWLAAIDLRLPFFLFAAVMVVCLMLALAIGGRRLELRPAPAPAREGLR
jgi:MFS family permease